jgi:hypothetical protein
MWTTSCSSSTFSCSSLFSSSCTSSSFLNPALPFDFSAYCPPYRFHHAPSVALQIALMCSFLEDLRLLSVTRLSCHLFGVVGCFCSALFSLSLFSLLQLCLVASYLPLVGYHFFSCDWLSYF